MHGSILHTIGELAARQVGLFTRAQAHAVGISDKVLRSALRQGVVVQVAPRVFRISGSAQTWHQSVLTACLAGGPRCVASHRTAAALHRLDGFVRGVVEVTVPMGVRFRHPRFVVHHSRNLPASDRVYIGPIPVTTIPRTLIDLGAVEPASRVEEALDSAERDGKARRYEVVGRHAELRARGRNGIGTMTTILAGRIDEGRVPRSVLERRFLRICARHGLPLPVMRFRICLPDGTVYELDAAYPSLRLGIETDGHGSHATRSQRAADHRRANALEQAGWTLRRFTYEQVMFDEPYVASTVRHALARARSAI